MPKRESDELLVEGPRGRIFTAKLAPDSVYFFFDGHIDLAMFAPSMGVANEVVRTGRGRLYGDGETWKTYEGGYRNAWTDWFLAHRKQLASTRLVVTSPILRMGVQVVNLFAGNPIESLARSSDLKAILRKEHPQLRELAADWPADVRARVVAG